MPLPGTTPFRPPRMPYGGRLFGTDAMSGANTQQYGNENMAGAIGGNLMDLLGGKNAAADQADRTNLTALSQIQKNQATGTQRTAAQMGIQPGDPRYATYMAKNNSDVQSMGSKLLGDAQTQRLNDQNRNLTTAIGFNQGQQNYGMDQARLGLDKAKLGESTREYDQNFGSSENQRELGNLKDIINNPLSSEGQVEAAKQRLLQAQGGLDSGLYNTPEKNQAQRAFDEIKNQLAVLNPGMAPDQLDAMARERFGQIDKAQYDSLTNANKMDNGAAASGDGGSDSIFSGNNILSPEGPVGDAYNAASLGGVSAIKGVGNTVGEMGRGVRDIGRGHVLEGTGRIFAAPAKGATHAVMDAGRSIGRTGRRILNLF